MRVCMWDQSLVHHTHVVMSLEVVTSVLPSGANAHELTPFVWLVRVRRWAQSHVHYTRTVASYEVVTRMPPSGANAHERTYHVWPVRVCK